MIKATVNGNKTFTVDGNQVEGIDLELDVLKINENNFHILKDNQSYNATVIAMNKEEKTAVIRVNNQDYEISIQDKYDLLLQQMGMSAGAAKIVTSFKAPMPGMIKEMAVSVGSTVEKGDILLILEAMKMENSLKSPRSGIIKKVAVETGKTVEKGQVLIEFE